MLYPLIIDTPTTLTYFQVPITIYINKFLVFSLSLTSLKEAFKRPENHPEPQIHNSRVYLVVIHIYCANLHTLTQSHNR